MNPNQNIGPLALNIPLLVTQILGFLLLLWFLNRFVFKPIFGILDERQKAIQDTYDQLDRDRAQHGTDTAAVRGAAGEY